MTHTTKHRTASGARSPAALSNHIVEELHRYDEHLRDVRGLAVGTRKNRLRVIGLLLQEKYKGRAIQFGKLRPDDIRQFLATRLGAHRNGHRRAGLVAGSVCCHASDGG